jgi:hypothetical protein
LPRLAAILEAHQARLAAPERQSGPEHTTPGIPSGEGRVRVGPHRGSMPRPSSPVQTPDSAGPR